MCMQLEKKKSKYSFVRRGATLFVHAIKKKKKKKKAKYSFVRRGATLFVHAIKKKKKKKAKYSFVR